MNITVTVTGADQVIRKMNALKGVAQEEYNEVAQTAQLFLREWKAAMPVESGFMRDTAIAVGRGPGKASAFTMTFGKKAGGYAIFPELGTHPGHTRPHFTEKTVEKFSNEWGAKAKNKIVQALR